MSKTDEHTVSSAKKPLTAKKTSKKVPTTKKVGGKQVSFTLPAMPKIGFKNIAARVKATGLATVLVVGLLGGYAGAWLQQSQSGSDIISASVGSDEKIVTSKSKLVSAIAGSVGPSVVSINVSVTSETGLNYFGFAPEQQSQGAGTGIILTKDGLIVTNRHVVPEGTTRVSVTLSDGTEFNNVKVVGRTSESDTLDIAILKITNVGDTKLKPATLGDSSRVSVGDDVVAIGNALGQFENTVTSGIVSGYGRSIVAGDSSGSYENLDNLFQTDAAINQGNSGGPLVNLNGQVIGINTAIASDSQNIGFAIPINDVKGLIERVTETGKFERPFLGVRYVPLTADIANEYDLNVENGAYIVPAADPASPSILADSAAAKGGLQEGDVITKVNNKTINETTSLTSLLAQYQPGDAVTLTVDRSGDTKQLRVTLGTAPSE